MSIFTEVQKRSLPRNKFDMSFANKLSCNFGYLVPIICKELMPGDSIRHRHSIFGQFAPMNSQVMQRFDIRTEYFFVPNRLIYNEFNDFLRGGEDGTDILTPPCVRMGDLYDDKKNYAVAGSLADYLGLPTVGTFGTYNEDRLISTLPFRAYQLIYKEWYRDENLIEDYEIPTAGGEEGSDTYDILFTIRRRAWKKDYFTSALPWAQKGPIVRIPIADVAYVYPFVGSDQQSFDPSLSIGLRSVDGQTYDFLRGGNTVDDGADTSYNFTLPENRELLDNAGHTDQEPRQATMPFTLGQDGYLGLIADLRSATATSIEELRRAYAVQHWLELNAIGGTRDVEMIYNHFGVKVPDYRLGRPEYIAGFAQPVNIGNIYSTENSNTDSGSVQAYPVSNAQSNGVSDITKYYAQEHGFFIGLMTIMPRAAYYQGIPRMFGRRQDKFDYYWPAFAQLGEQPIYADELYVNSNEDDIFGYTPRYAEFKFSTDEIHGEFRTNLDFMHDARKFSAEPQLNQTFIEVNANVDELNRIFNYTLEDTHHIYVDIFHQLSKVSSMVYFGNPKL